MRRRTAIALAGAGASALLIAGTLPILADDGKAVTIASVADTTGSLVPQDGDNRVKTTLASCPQLCDRNRNGLREPLIAFDIAELPANVSKVTAKLRVYAWSSFDARVDAYAVGGGAEEVRPPVSQVGPAALSQLGKVSQGFNEWDVSGAINGNGRYTFALRQLTYNTPIYWASRDNRRETIRPQLLLAYEVGGSDGVAKPPPPRPIPTTAAPQPTKSPDGSSTSRPAPAPTTPKPSASQPDNPPPPGNPAGWNLKWSDEFNGGAIDSSKWNTRHEGRSTDVACNTASSKNQFLSGGMLTLRALKESVQCSGQTRQYSEGYLDTIGKHSWTYGRFEMRAKSPNGPTNSKGLWPAFWLRPNDGGNGEIDVVELPGGSYYKQATLGIFYNYSPIKQDIGARVPDGGYPGDGFHTYTTEWEPGVLRWYIDGVKVWERNRSTTPWFDEVFSKPYNIRLNFQTGGWLGNPDASTQFPADFVVDYVRVYQR
jgi:beta-glucanase (GH16 family)